MADGLVIFDAGLVLRTVATKDRSGVHFQKTLPGPSIEDGCSNYHVVALGSANEAIVKASPGQIYGVHAFCPADYPVFIKFHNGAGTPTPGVGVVHTVAVEVDKRADVVFPSGLSFAAGIGITIVKGLADNSAVAVLAGDAVVDVLYK